jgi:hypothetical protein
MAQQRLLRDRLALVKHIHLDILTPTSANSLPVEMDLVNFRATFIDFPMTINPDQLHSLITHYTIRNRKIDYQQFINDLQNSERGDTLSSRPKGISPKFMSLAKELQEAHSGLTRLVEPFDKNRTGKVFLGIFAGLCINCHRREFLPKIS